MNPTSFTQKLLLSCVSVLLAALALRWAVQIFEQIWPELAIGVGVVLAVIGLITLVRHRTNGW